MSGRTQNSATPSEKRAENVRLDISRQGSTLAVGFWALPGRYERRNRNASQNSRKTRSGNSKSRVFCAQSVVLSMLRSDPERRCKFRAISLVLFAFTCRSNL